MLFVLIFCQSLLVVSGVIYKNVTINNNKIMRVRVLNLKAYKDTGYVQEAVFLNQATTIAANSSSPGKCANWCVTIKKCCGFFFKKNEICAFVDSFYSLNNKTVEKQGVTYYEDKVVCLIMIILSSLL